MEREAATLNAGSLRTATAYGAMIAATILAFFFIDSLGQYLTAPAPHAATGLASPGGTDHSHVFPHILLALVVVILAARLLGTVFRRLQQPPVIGEVIAGILLGPSFLGSIAPEAAAFLLPPKIAPFLEVLAQVGVVLFMFLVGLELDTSVLRRKAHATIAISHASIVAPFLLGSLLAVLLYPRLATSDVRFTTFALFMGVSMSVTAFPVLARILTDRGMHRSRLGVVALACAAVDDVSAWCLLALVVSVAQARIDSALPTIIMTLAYIATMFTVVKPLVRRAVQGQQQVTQTTVAVVFVALLSSALVTESIGIHAVFGAFFLGAVIPHDSLLAKDMCHKLEDIVVVLLLPAFFAFTGMRTQVALVSGFGEWMICGAIILVACVGKFGGSSVAARLSGLSWRDAACLGVLLNTRGLMELVVLNIGLDLGVISPTLFAMMVLMALATTVATTPILQRLRPSHADAESRLHAVGAQRHRRLA